MSNYFDGGFKERERSKYDELNLELSEVRYPIYIVSGTPYWKKYIIDRLSETIGRRPENVSEDIEPYLERMRYRSLKRKKHFTLFQSGGKKLKKGDFESLSDYFGDPSENGVLVIELNDWFEKRYFLKAFRMLRRSNRIKFIELDFTSNYFRELHLLNKLENINIKFESDKLRNKAVKNIILNLEELDDNIMTLESFDGEIISEDDYDNSIEKYSDNTLDKFYDSLTFVNRKTVPYKIIKELLEEGRSANYLLRGIDRHFNLLYQAKYLRSNGIMRPHDIEDEKFEIYKDAGLLFSSPNIWDTNKRRRNKYLEDCAKISIKEIVYVLMLIEEAYIINRVDRNGEVSYTKFTNKERLMKLVMEIMSRRVED